ncbi:MAG: Sir2 family NAD-dependent protein deacetylase [Polyangiaceae bacterium]
MTEAELATQHQRAASAVAGAGALLITAGAGMGVDSGMPDFRGPEGFWRAYPPYRALGLRFEQMANPRWFDKDPRLAWGFYGHRLTLYRKIAPHAGFAVLRRFASRLPHGAFVYTSNVDCHFQRAGFPPDRLVECHGTFEYFQCVSSCGVAPFPSEDFRIDVDPETFRARGPLPACPRCRGLARPNILMFGDFAWESSRADDQESRMHGWLAKVRADNAPLVVIEAGAGTAIPTVRRMGERLTQTAGATLIRINVREPEVPTGHIGIAQGALAALTAIEHRMTPA